MIHELKILPKYYEAVSNGSKSFEIRFNDRDFKIGDTLKLQEYIDGVYTGRSLQREVSYILNDSNYIKNGYIILGLINNTNHYIFKVVRDYKKENYLICRQGKVFIGYILGNFACCKESLEQFTIPLEYIEKISRVEFKPL
ncbi:TPA: DUF3850 domain-containing protein [Clostridioides difficile]|nr:DUF3850 domain-containing protein [Clostridioides difficile]MBY2558205.1 DUF3850 domain-containing protein [Clostridioides difficile]MCL6900182.1 DUF3850 domain-containing protein [Clostridioides difficile]MDE3492376.1 DUF3850 domain-containing protein [Clostridioides difficile]MDE3706856.1 DUF3850 domain-containing protein [Clostridioides difficile]